MNVQCENESDLRTGNDVIPTRQSLLGRLKDWNDHRSWKTFFDTYWRLIYNTALKAGLTDVEAQEVVQETLISVSKSMPGFRYDPQKGSFKTWLMRLTHWRIQRQLAKRPPAGRFAVEEPETATGTEAMDRIPDPAAMPLETRWDIEWEENLVAAAIDRVKHKVDPKQFQIFDYCVLKYVPVSHVVAALGVSRAVVYLARHRISRLIRREITKLRAQPF